MTLADRRLVFAHYFLWFGTPARSGHWGNWKWNGPGCRHDPGRRKNGLADIAAVGYPLLGPYDSSDPAVLRRHVRWARDAGLDFFAVDWYGPAGRPGSTAKYARVDANFSALLDVCEKNRFKAAICYEEKLLFENSTGADRRVSMGVDHLTYLFDAYARHPGYQKLDGRPVLVVWGDHTLRTREWLEMMSTVRGKHDPVVVYSYFFKNDARQKTWYENLVRKKSDPPYVDSLYPWLLIGSKKSIFSRLDVQYARLRDLKRRELVDFVTGSVWADFDDTGVWAWGGPKPRVIPDSDGLYEMTWKTAMENKADWISIATWNDWNEGSQIEPDAVGGERLLELTSRFTRTFK